MQSLTPTSLEDLAQSLSFLAAGDKILAGGTDLVIQLRRGKYEPERVLYLGDVPELRKITVTDKLVRIGSMATMAEIAAELESIPALQAVADAASDVGSPQVRNKATMAGNLCNASPAGDMLPVSWLLDAGVEILSADGTLSVRPVQELILGPQKSALACNQAVTAILFDRQIWSGFVSAFCKIGSREKVSISREGMGLALKCSGGIVLDARITVGAVASTPLRVDEAEQMLRNRPLTEKLADQVTPIISKAIHDHCRPANRTYKTEAARGLTADVFFKLWQRQRH